MFTPKFKRTVSRILPFGAIWLATSLIFLINDITLTRYQNLNPSTDITLSLPVIIFGELAMGMVGLLVGTFEVVILEKRFRNYSLLRRVIYKLGVYLFLMLGLIAILYPMAAAIEANTGFANAEIWSKTVRFFSSLTFLNTFLQLFFVLLLSLVYAAVAENLGHHVLRNFFTGKYHKPIIEKRIFMFLDMKHSTTIAEQLGHVKYYELLKEYYELMSDSIIRFKGEVYQYIGDEVVISWKEQPGLDDANCIKCFYAIKAQLDTLSDAFMDKFEVIPDFKAGIHVGEVTTGEIGALKKEIVFTGDVLNTTARIQGLCKEYKSDLIVSNLLLSGIGNVNAFETTSLGQLTLRGKSKAIELFAVTPKA